LDTPSYLAASEQIRVEEVTPIWMEYTYFPNKFFHTFNNGPDIYSLLLQILLLHN